MTTILTHGDGDGVCSAALIKMTRQYRDASVYFTHPLGIVEDLRELRDDIFVCDIAIDKHEYKKLYKILDEMIEEGYFVTYIDHHLLPGPLPPGVILVHDEKACATELVYRYLYYKLPENSSHIALIGAINDYLDDTPLMRELMHHYERRTLFLDAGILAQGIKSIQKDYVLMRELVQDLAMGKYPCELKGLINRALKTTRYDKHAREIVLKNYKKLKFIAYVINPPASRSKAAHWIMGHSGKIVGITVLDHPNRKEIVDLTIRGRNLIDLRTIIPRLAKDMGGSGGGHANACGCRIPKRNLHQFLSELDEILLKKNLHNGKKIEDLLQLEKIVK